MSAILTPIKSGRTFVSKCRGKGEGVEAYNVIPEWNEIKFRKPTLDERNYFDSRDDTRIVENLPEYEEHVLVTDGIHIWVDYFDEDADGVYLSGTGDDVNSVTAWMPLPNPYKGGAHK